MLIDVDDPQTWPQDIAAHVEETAERLRGTTEYASDLRLDPSEDETFRSLFEGRLVRSYHATRLLEHEVASIRERGLIPLSPGLISWRIDEALERGFISEEEASRLRLGNVFAERSRTAGTRAGHIALFISRPTLDLHVSGLWSLLSNWGGEGVYMSAGGHELEKEGVLRRLGAPAVVVAGVDVAGSWRRHLIFPGIANSFVGRFLGFEDYGSEVHYYEPITADRIFDIWSPGEAEYDRHGELPR